MECAQEELKKLLRKCENRKVNLREVKVIDKFLKDNKKTTVGIKKWLKFVVFMGVLTFALHYYLNDMRSRVTKVYPVK